MIPRRHGRGIGRPLITWASVVSAASRAPTRTRYWKLDHEHRATSAQVGGRHPSANLPAVPAAADRADGGRAARARSRRWTFGRLGLITDPETGRRRTVWGADRGLTLLAALLRLALPRELRRRPWPCVMNHGRSFAGQLEASSRCTRSPGGGSRHRVHVRADGGGSGRFPRNREVAAYRGRVLTQHDDCRSRLRWGQCASIQVTSHRWQVASGVVAHRDGATASGMLHAMAPSAWLDDATDLCTIISSSARHVP